MSKIKTLKLSEIVHDGGTQQREKIDEKVVADYVEAMNGGVKFPPLVTFFDGAQHWLADGFHRYWAYRGAGIDECEVDVRDGLARDAILYSFGANARHGLRRTNADKAKAVTAMLNDAEWSQWSARKIAEQCGVSNNFVSVIIKKITHVKQPREVSSDDTVGKNYNKIKGEKNVKFTTSSGKTASHTVKNPVEDPSIEYDDEADYGPSAAELAEITPDDIAAHDMAEVEQSADDERKRKAMEEDFEAFVKLLDSKDPLAEAVEKRRIAEERYAGMKAQNNVLIKAVKRLQARLRKANLDWSV
jgi:hypothetical protein